MPRLQSLWDDRHAASLEPVDLLVYQSNLLGADPRITNFGGGNTSAKLPSLDPISGETVEVLWVKGSGGDLGTMTREGLASVRMDRFLLLEKRSDLHEDEIVALYPHCTFGLNPTPASIDTPLHGLIPRRFVNHVHADACIAIAAAEDSEALTAECFGASVGYVPWKRPGFELGLMCRRALEENPGIDGLLMGSHGIICWADDQREVYELTLRLINRAYEFVESHFKGEHPFGPVVRPREAPEARKRILELLPILRGLACHEGRRMIAHVDQSEPVLHFLSRAKMHDLAAMGTSCPDHFLRTKIAPLVLEQEDPTIAFAQYRERYGAYYERCRRPDSPPMRNPNPSVVLIPGFGMVAFGKNPLEARVTAEFYARAIEVMRGAETLSRYTALPEQEAFDIEYWWLEENKLRRQPPEKPLSRQVALVTGAAQGIGKATAERLRAEGACVVALDLDQARLSEAFADSPDVVSVPCDVTDSSALRSAFETAVLAFGGVDIVVANAGNALRGTIADTTDEDFGFLSDLLMKAYFESLREAAGLMIRQGTGGNLIVVGSKNAVATGSNAAVYSAAKAFELHLMRTAANDLAVHGIRANGVNPDAVLQGSGIWSDRWREETAKSLGIAPSELEEHYRKRSLLGVAVRPDDVAAAIFWLCSDAASRTTGAVIPVDGGIREGFLR
jgi:rhamnulose-1-phosphate aldolase/alcohol dehydrogenase